jgi:signal transduction histidine kinase
VHLLAAFVATNRWVISILYPLTFFLIGFGILLKNKVHSRFHLGNSLNYLGIFSVIHSFADWANSFIPLQGAYLNDATLLWLKYGQIVLRSISFTVLLYFGIHLLQQSKLLSRRTLFLPATFFSIWFIISFCIKLLLTGTASMPINLILSNILITIPAGLLSAYSIYIQKEQFVEYGIHFMRKTLIFTSISLVAYTLWVGYVFPCRLWFSGSTIEWLRSLNVTVIFISILRILRVFDIEYQQYFLTAEMKEAVAEERNRIARDLHDGMIQSIYAFGLQLDALRYQFESEKVPDAKMVANRLREMTHKTNGLIAEIRNYIVELRTDSDGSSNFHQKVESLIEDANRTSKVHVQFQCVYKAIEPPLWVSNQIYYIIKEAVSNIVKHSHASEAAVIVQGNSTYLSVEIRDNGQGFQPAASFDFNGLRQGIKNMNDRAKVIGGELTIDSLMGLGTSVKLNVTLN